jgi:methionyl aminopeptidase
MTVRSAGDLAGMKRVGAVVHHALGALKAAVRPGVTPADLDRLCGEVFARYGAKSAPREVYGAPVNVFVSLNADVVHGLPSRIPLEPGDVVKLDVTPVLDGFVADAAVTVALPPVSPRAAALIACTEAAFWAGLKRVRAGRPLSGVGRAVEREVSRCGFRVIRELAGHGVGRTIHEEPEVPNCFDPAERRRLNEGLVLALEPMIAAGRSDTETRPDGWTIGTKDGSLTAHFEHTVMVTRGKPLILTR